MALLDMGVRNSKKDLKERNKNEKLFWIKNFISKSYVLLVVNFGWILFRAPHTRDALQYIGIMLGFIVPEFVGYTVFWYLDKWTITIMMVGIFFASSLPITLCDFVKNLCSWKIFYVVSSVVCFDIANCVRNV